MAQAADRPWWRSLPELRERRRSGLARAGRWLVVLAVAAGVASAVLVGVQGQWESAIRFTLVTLALVAARQVTPAPFAAAFSVFLLVATWMTAEHWYRSTGQVDEAVHFLTVGALATVGYFALVRARLLPEPSSAPGLRRWAPAIWVLLAGVTGAVLWEFYEWTVEELAPDQMAAVGYTDTIADLMAGMLGSLAAGALVVRWQRWRSRRENAGRRPEPRSP